MKNKKVMDCPRSTVENATKARIAMRGNALQTVRRDFPEELQGPPAGPTPPDQRKTPWVDSACANCPGILVLGTAPASASTFVLGPQIAPLR